MNDEESEWIFPFFETKLPLLRWRSLHQKSEFRFICNRFYIDEVYQVGDSKLIARERYIPPRRDDYWVVSECLLVDVLLRHCETMSGLNAPITLGCIRSMKVKCRASDPISLMWGKIKSAFDDRCRDSPLKEKLNTLMRHWAEMWSHCSYSPSSFKTFVCLMSRRSPFTKIKDY
jgi:hypothetical protein